MRLSTLLLSACLAFAAPLSASADVKGPNGEKCDKVEAKLKHPIGGKQYTCDKCTFSKCDTSTKEIKGCVAVTHWTNCEEDVAPKKPDASPAKTPPAKK